MAATGVSAALGRLQAELDHLRQLPSGEALLGDPVALPAAKYRFLVAVAAAIQACGRVIAGGGLRWGSDAADGFRVLAEQNLVSVDLTDRLLDAVAVRDRLVAGTAADGAFVAGLPMRIDDLDRFRAEVGSPPEVRVE